MCIDWTIFIDGLLLMVENGPPTSGGIPGITHGLAQLKYGSVLGLAGAQPMHGGNITSIYIIM